MPDLLVRLYDLPAHDAARVSSQGITIRRALTPERRQVLDWIEKHFGPKWAAESETGFGGHPIMTWIAVKDGDMLGFGCGDATAKGFFGPAGVIEDRRGQGVGEALLFAVLNGLHEAGYAYAIIGDPGPIEFYRNRLDALEIPASWPGIYRGMLGTS